MDAEVEAGFLGCELTLPLPLSHGYFGKALEGARAVLDDMLMKFNTDIDGVLLAYSKLRPAEGKAASLPGGTYIASHTAEPICRIFEELPVMHARVTMDALLFKPQLGDILKGKVQAIGSGHISVLIGGLFNAAILKDDMAGAYDYDESARAWVVNSNASNLSGVSASAASGSKRKRSEADGNIKLGASGTKIEEGTAIVFVVRGISNASGVLAVRGTFDPAFMAHNYVADKDSKAAKQPRHNTVESIEHSEKDDVVEHHKKEKKEKKDKKEKKSKA